MMTPEIQSQVQVCLDCNLRCAYCFQDHVPGTMNLSTVAVLLNKLAKANPYPLRHRLGNREKEPLTVTWHGGEPLMAGPDFFKGVVRIQKEIGADFDNRLQTNATLMTSDLANLFFDRKFQVGFSLDGPEAIHNRHRKFKGTGRGSFSRTMAGINLFKKVSGLEILPVIAVITRDSMEHADEIFSFFRDLGAKVQLDIFDLRFQDFIPSLTKKTDPFRLAPTAPALKSFLIRLFDLWFDDPSGQIDFPEFRDEVKMVLQPEMEKGNPYHKKRCSLGRIVFSPEGKAFSCDQYLNEAKTALGDIQIESLKKIFQRKTRLWEDIKRGIRGTGEHMACASCERGRSHSGGCLTCLKYTVKLLRARHKGLSDKDWRQAELPSTLSRIRGETYYCDSLRQLRNHARKRIEEAMGHV